MKKVIVIGAGAAGLMAATKLRSHAVDTIVLEARNRMGGRIHTHYDPGVPYPIELGAEFIHGRPPQIFQLADHYHLSICETSERHWRMMGSNQQHTFSRSEEFWKRLHKVFTAMKRRKKDVSFADFLSRSSADPKTKKTAAHYIEGFHAADTNLIGVHGLNLVNKAADEMNGDSNYRFIRGYHSLIQALSEEAIQSGAKLHLNTVAREIHWKPGEVKVQCNTDSGDREFVASHVVMTVPPTVLAESIRFTPDINEWKEAVRGINVGYVARAILLFQECFWEKLHLRTTTGMESGFNVGFIHSPDCPIPTWWTQSPVRVPYLVGWAGGPRAEKFKSLDQIHDAAFQSLSSIFRVPIPQLRNLLIKIYFHDWSSDPFSRGGYSYVGVNGLKSQKTLAKSIAGTIFFAGEATETQGHSGTVHGALMTGNRAASEILKS